MKYLKEFKNIDKFNYAYPPDFFDKEGVEKVASELGEEVDSYVGGGAYGFAFKLKSGKILKLTPSEDEVLASNKLRKLSSSKHIVGIYDVRKIEDTDSPHDDEQWYVITQDEVKTLSEDEQKIYANFYWLFFREQYSDEDFIKRIRREADYKDIGWWEKILPQRQSIIKDLVKFGIDKREAHAGNIGFDKHGRFKIFDLQFRSKRSDKYYNDHGYYNYGKMNKPIKRFESFINEEFDKEFDKELAKLVIMLKQECPQYIEDLKRWNKGRKIGSHPSESNPPLMLWRGSNTGVGLNEAKLKKVRKDRQPLDMSQDIQQQFDDVFDNKFGFRPRSEGSFSTFDEYTAERYGTSFLIFPKGKYRTIWTNEFTDLWDYISTEYGTIFSKIKEHLIKDRNYKELVIKYKGIDTGVTVNEEQYNRLKDKYDLKHELSGHFAKLPHKTMLRVYKQSFEDFYSKADKKDMSVYRPSDEYTDLQYSDLKAEQIEFMRYDAITDIVNTYQEDNLDDLLRGVKDILPENEITIMCDEYYLVNANEYDLIKRLIN